MAEISRAMGLPESFEYDGKTWKLSPVTFEVMALWEQWFERHAREKTMQAKSYLTPIDYKEKSDAVERDIIAGEYGFFSEAGIKSKRNLFGPGCKKLLQIRLTMYHGDVDDGTLSGMIDKAAEDIAAAMARMETSNPNSLTPGKPGVDANGSQALSPNSGTPGDPLTKSGSSTPTSSETSSGIAEPIKD